MFKFLKKLVRFRVGQKITRGTARKLGLGPLSGLIGVIGGMRAARHH